MPFSFRQLAFSATALCAGLIAAALYFQHGMGLEPCPLCIFQRLAVMATGLVFLAAALHNPSTMLGRRCYGGLALITSGSGVAVAGRHLWLQSLPADQVPSCGPGLDYMLETFPLHKALAMVFSGSGECAEVQWRMLGLTMPGWTMLFFILLGLLGIVFLFAKPAK